MGQIQIWEIKSTPHGEVENGIPSQCELEGLGKKLQGVEETEVWSAM